MSPLYTYSSNHECHCLPPLGTGKTSILQVLLGELHGRPRLLSQNIRKLRFRTSKLRIKLVSFARFWICVSQPKVSIATVSSEPVKSSLLQALPRSSKLYTARGVEEHQRWEIKMCLRKCVPKNLRLNQNSFIHIVALICIVIFSQMTYFQCSFVFLRSLMPASDFVTNFSDPFVCVVRYKNISALMTSHTSTMCNDLRQQPCPTSKLKAPYLPPTVSLPQFLNSKSHTNQEKATHTNPPVHRSLHPELGLIMCFLRVSLCSPGWHQTHSSFSCLGLPNVGNMERAWLDFLLKYFWVGIKPNWSRFCLCGIK